MAAATPSVSAASTAAAAAVTTSIGILSQDAVRFHLDDSATASSSWAPATAASVPAATSHRCHYPSTINIANGTLPAAPACFGDGDVKEFIVCSGARHIRLIDVIVLLAVVVSYCMSIPRIVKGVLAVVVAARVVQKLYTVKTESILVVRTVGVQLSTTYLLGGRQTRFIPRDKVRTLVLNEGLSHMTIRFYLAVCIDGDSELCVVFPNLLPRLDILEVVFKECINVLEDRPTPSKRPS